MEKKQIIEAIKQELGEDIFTKKFSSPEEAICLHGATNFKIAIDKATFKPKKFFSIVITGNYIIAEIDLRQWVDNQKSYWKYELI